MIDLLLMLVQAVYRGEAPEPTCYCDAIKHTCPCSAPQSDDDQSAKADCGSDGATVIHNGGAGAYAAQWTQYDTVTGGHSEAQSADLLPLLSPSELHAIWKDYIPTDDSTELMITP